MSSKSGHSLEKKWVRKLPRSKMVYPSSFKDRIKYIFWRLYTPAHPIVRNTTVALRVVKPIHKGRQDYLLGIIAPGVETKDFISFLTEKGYGKHSVALKDEGELISLRYLDNFVYQYHIRIFKDREVRGHYEYTPECYPIAHWFKRGVEARREEFLELFGEMIIPFKNPDLDGDDNNPQDGNVIFPD
ncbi:MAG: hypothetical protein WC835_02995 [Candidatus Paceibacterota bacterium]|jgi:hypothetical protein